MIAVIQTGGKQYIARKGETIRVEKLEKKQGEEICFDPLLIADETGKSITIGAPVIESHPVVCKVVRQGREKKIRVIKYKSKTRYFRRIGHRQAFTEIMINQV